MNPPYPHAFTPVLGGICGVCGLDRDDPDPTLCDHDPAHSCATCPRAHISLRLFLVLFGDGLTFEQTTDEERAREAAEHIGGVVVEVPMVVIADHRKGQAQ